MAGDHCRCGQGTTALSIGTLVRPKEGDLLETLLRLKRARLETWWEGHEMGVLAASLITRRTTQGG